MATPNITPRKVLQDLGYAPRLNAPEPIMQPSPQIPLPARDTETTQLVSALGEINKNINVYAEQYTSQREQADIDNAAANSIKLLDEAKASQTKTGQGIQAFVDANMINYGSSPKVRKYLYTMIGERLATEGYTKLLEESRNRVANNLKPENADDVIDELRPKFLKELGDNMYSRAGAESVMRQADAAFRSFARGQQDEYVKQQTLTNFNIKTGQLFKEGIALNDPQVTAGNVYQLRDTLRQAGIDNWETIWAQAVETSATQMATEGHGLEARNIIERLKTQAVKTTDAKGVESVIGVLGDSASMAAVFERIDHNILKASTLKDDMDSAKAESRNRRINNQANDVVNTVLSESKDLNDPAIPLKIKEAIDKITTVPAERIKLQQEANMALQQALEKLQVTPVENLVEYNKAVNTNDFSRAAEIYATFSPTDKVRYDANHQAFLSNATIINSPHLKSAGALIQAKLKESLKFTESDPDAASKYAVMVDAQAKYDEMVGTVVREDSKNWKGLSKDEIQSRIVGLVGKESTDLLDKAVKAYADNKNAPRAGAASSLPPKPIKGLQPVSATKAYTNEQQLESSAKWITSAIRLNQESNLSGQFLNPKTQKFANQAKESIQNIWTSMSPNLVSMSRFGKDIRGVPVTPQMQEAATENYLGLKRLMGFNPQEILTGKTTEGVTFDVAKVVSEQPNFAYETKFFPSQQEFLKSFQEYAGLTQALTSATTEEQKQVIRYKLGTNAYAQLTTKLLPKTGIASIDADNEKIFLTNQKAMLPSVATTGTQIPVSVTETFIKEAAGKGTLNPTTPVMTAPQELATRIAIKMEQKGTQIEKLSAMEREQVYSEVMADMRTNTSPVVSADMPKDYKELKGFFNPTSEWFLLNRVFGNKGSGLGLGDLYLPPFPTEKLTTPVYRAANVIGNLIDNPGASDFAKQAIIEPLKRAGKVAPLNPDVLTTPQALDRAGKVLDIQQTGDTKPTTTEKAPVRRTRSAETDNSRLRVPPAKPDISEKYWVQNYNTQLDADNEKRFQVWFGQQSKDIQSYRNRSLYDLRGYWLNGGHKSKATKIPDAYKKPERPTQ